MPLPSLLLFSVLTVSPTTSCDAQLRDIEDARLTLRGLLRSERTLRRQHARARSRHHKNDVLRLLEPIATQARALQRVIEQQERRYLRCVEAQLDAPAVPAHSA